MQHLQSGWGVASLLTQLRRTSRCVGVEVQSLVPVSTPEGRLLVTAAACVTVAFSAAASESRPLWQIPWLAGLPLLREWQTVHFLLDIDLGVAPDRTIADRAQAIAKAMPILQSMLGGPVRPVILTPPGPRARTVAALWKSAWPQSPALLASTKTVSDPTYGVMWGSYLPISDPTKRTRLFGNLIPSPEHWAQMCDLS